jgi:hypothetical protein
MWNKSREYGHLSPVPHFEGNASVFPIQYNVDWKFVKLSISYYKASHSLLLPSSAFTYTHTFACGIFICFSSTSISEDPRLLQISAGSCFKSQLNAISSIKSNDFGNRNSPPFL